MRIEAWIFGGNALFVAIVTPCYWFISGDPTGTAALIMTFGLCALVTFYLGFHANKMEPRPEDNKLGEIVDGAGELGFFPPYSWWPLWCALGAVGLRARRRLRLVAVHHRRVCRFHHTFRLGLRVLPRRTRALTRSDAASDEPDGAASRNDISWRPGWLIFWPDRRN